MKELVKSSDVFIIGSGIIGLACAYNPGQLYFLHSVTVLEKKPVGTIREKTKITEQSGFA